MNEEPKEPARVGQGMDYGEQADVQQVHAAVQREKREPRVGAEPLSIWLIAIYGLAIFFGGAYLGRYSGNFSSGGSCWRRAGGGIIAPRSRQEGFLGELSDLSSSQWSRRAGSISASCRFRIYNWRLATHGHDSTQRFAGPG